MKKIEEKMQTGKMAQQMKELPTKSDNPSSIPKNLHCGSKEVIALTTCQS